MSSIGATSGTFMLNFIGMVVREEVENLKFVNNFTSESFVCMRPNLNPMQLRGPSPVKIQNYIFLSLKVLNLPNGMNAIG